MNVKKHPSQLCKAQCDSFRCLVQFNQKFQYPQIFCLVREFGTDCSFMVNYLIYLMKYLILFNTIYLLQFLANKPISQNYLQRNTHECQNTHTQCFLHIQSFSLHCGSYLITLTLLCTSAPVL